MLWYLTYSFSFDNTTHEILSSSSQINKLSNEINTFVLQLITNSYGEKDSEQKIPFKELSLVYTSSKIVHLHLY